MEKSSFFQDYNQNFWELACIQSAGSGVPVIIIGGQLAKVCGAGTALLSVCIGNLLLWLVGLAVVSMAARERKDAVENIKQYFGKYVGYIVSGILIFAFLTWYVLQLKGNVEAIGGLSRNSHFWHSIKGLVAGALGIITALLAIGGIRLIKRLCCFAFPFLLIFMIYAAITSDRMSVTFTGTWGFSLTAIAATVAITLPGVVNLPTFFRHSRSRAHSVLGLTLMALFVTLFQTLSILLDVGHPSEIFQQFTINSNILKFLFAVTFVVLSLLCVNLVNIYFAASGLQNFIPRHWNKYGKYAYALEGMVGLVIAHSNISFQFFENMVGNFISSLGIVLVAALLVRNVVKHRIRKFDRPINILCWGVGCIAASIGQFGFGHDSGTSLLTGIYASTLMFLCVLFIEETHWSLENINY